MTLKEFTLSLKSMQPGENRNFPSHRVHVVRGDFRPSVFYVYDIEHRLIASGPLATIAKWLAKRAGTAVRTGGRPPK